jgi:hypothetical protein
MNGNLIERQAKKIVSIGIKFVRIGEIDVMHEKFYADVLVVAQWKHDRVVGHYDQANDWSPELFVENNIEKLKTNVYRRIEPNGDESCTITETSTFEGMRLD